MNVLRIFSDAGGVARVERREVPLQRDAQGRATSPAFAARQFFFRETPPGHVHGQHRAPQRQLIFVTGGTGEIELDDGSRWPFGPGDLIFAENTTGQGHVTRTLEGTRGFVHVTVPDDFAITDWPLVDRS
jgi:quercetin dioxygenase-like cupin family protein